jgi:hypothetical protein
MLNKALSVLASLAMLSIHQMASAAPLVPRDDDYWTLRGSLDSNWSRGSTDVNGDYKELDLAYFHKEFMLSARNKLASPQNARASVGFDTAVALLTAGWDKGLARAYVSLGYQNGGLLGAGQTLLGAAHRAMGFKGARISPASTLGKAVALVELAAERPTALLRREDVEIGVDPLVWATLGSPRTGLGAGLFGVVSWRTPLEAVRINPTAFAQARADGDFIYAGVALAHIVHDDLYRGQHVREATPSAIVGFRARLGTFVLAAQFDRMLSAEVRGARARAVDRLSVSFGRRL